MDENTKIHGETHSITRRTFITRASLMGAAALAATGLAACGEARSGSPSSASASSNATSSSAAGATSIASSDVPAAVQGKALVAFFSRAGDNYEGYLEEGNTEIVAMMLTGKVVADVFRIEPAESYPDDYDECCDVAKKEQAAKARPALAAQLENLADYDMIYLGYPIWWTDLPMIVYTFLESQDWTGKTIAPFCTHGGSGLCSTDETIRSVCNGATVLEGLAIEGAVVQNDRAQAEQAVNVWLAQVRS